MGSLADAEDEVRPSDPSQAPGLVGRTSRSGIGLLLLGSIGGLYRAGPAEFTLASAAVAVGLALIYFGLHRLVSGGSAQFGPLAGAILALVPVAAVYTLGVGGGPIFGAGEGQLGALTFLGVSLVVSGLRGDSGCEVMAVPNAIAGNRSHLPCLVFSPLDRLERRWSAQSRTP